METDNELEGQLLQQFSSLGTTDKDVLISEFQKLLGNQLNPGECAFFLDMNNWNLQAAVWSYYEYNQPSNKGPQFKFIGDITEGEGEDVPPNTRFTKTWRISNSGEERWPPGCHVKFCEGENLSLTDRTIVDCLEPGQVVDVTMVMQSGEAGTFQSKWRMSTATGLLFGEPIWVIVTVAEGGVLGVTQQLSKFGTDFLHTSNNVQQDNIPNPFASPTKSTVEHNFGASPQNSLIAHHGSPNLTPVSPSPTHSPHHVDINGSTVRSLFPTAIDDRPGSHSDTNCTDMQEDMS